MSLSEYLKLNKLGGQFAELYSSVREGIPCSAFGVQFSEKCHLASMLDIPVLYITPTAVGGRQAAEEMCELSGKKAVFLPAKDDVVLFKRSFDKANLYARLTALADMKEGADIVVTTPEALLQLFPKDIAVETLSEGREYSVETIVQKLVSMGYRRAESVDARGMFSLRGDILDIFPINSEEPVRAEFFGDELEKIHTFDLSGGLRKERVGSVRIVMATDVVIGENERQSLISKVKTSYSRTPRSFMYNRAATIYSELVTALESGGNADCLQFIIPLLSSVTANIFDLLPDDTAVVFDECKLLTDNFEMNEKEHAERISRFLKSGEAYDFTASQMTDWRKLINSCNGHRRLAVQSLTSTNKIFSPLRTFKFNCTAVPKYSMRSGDAVTDIGNWKRGGYRVIACCAGEDRAARLLDDLQGSRVEADVTDAFPQDFTGVKLTSYILSTGLIYHDAKLVVIGSGDMYLKSSSEKKLRKRRGDMFSAPVVGDYAVHEQYGVGIVRGTKRIETTAGEKDYVALEYAEGDVLYVSVEQMDKLTKYLAGEEKPKLNRIGGRDFEKIKERVRQSIARMTINLKALYRERAERKGFRFSPDDDLMRLFESAFEFEETEDQLSSSAEIKADMESDKVMDRLLCGDVGFGKTEVALRAAFKAVLDGKQVALIAPTTILSRQHYETCVSRFKGFGVNIDYVNRFKTSAEQRQSLLKLAAGDTDIIIGTHRLFGKDVKFKDLGLLILDEEQRFGVEHKERIKTLKTNVDTLTLTATPIPRTLHMSLTGIRDISTINTPPKSRIPVQTYVAEESDELIRDAVTREIARGGQVFILYNRVESIERFSADLGGFLPEEAKMITAHGRMGERELEDAVTRFYNGDANVLVATTIIENGIDLPNANTLIVIDADRLGLSTLYQLKGRVGRSDRMAHAYFTFKPDKVMSEAAYKRLNAIMEFSDMGSGFRVAMRDLEIRGAGNVLGREQHGHMEKVGYELYAKLLKEQLGEVGQETDAEMDVRVSAFIPEEYISESSARMDCYKQIAEIRTRADRDRILSSLRDVYGAPPKEVFYLIQIASLRRAACNANAVKVTVKAGSGEIVFANLKALDSDALHSALTANSACTSLSVGERPVIKVERNTESAADTLAFMLGLLDFDKEFSPI